MQHGNASRAPERDGFRIGTVASLTGLHPHTIRAWERRYRAVCPARSEGGTRLYGEDDVARLQLMKALQDRGESLSRIAGMPRVALEDRLRRLVEPFEPSGGPRREAHPPRVAVLEPGVAAQIRANALGLGPALLVGEETEPDAFLRLVRERKPDFLVLGEAQLGSQLLPLLEACLGAVPGARALIVYDFAPRHRLERLARSGARLVRGPLSLGMLCRLVLEPWAPPTDATRALEVEPPRPPAREGVPARLFDDVQLGRLRETTTGVACECPNHLATLVASLLAFERYCAECESRDADDAELHRRLGLGTAEARVTMERLLVRLCAHDGIRV